MVVLALGLQSQADLAAAAAILLAVNVSAVLPATPSNVGVFQAACLVVLAAYGVGAGPAWPTASSCRRSRSLTALALGVPGAARRGPDLAGHPRATSMRRLSRTAPTQPAQRSRAPSDWRSERVVCSTAVGS